MKKIVKIFLIVSLLLSTLLQAKHLNKERYYQNILCNKFKGQVEYRLKDKTRVDCLTSGVVT